MQLLSAIDHSFDHQELTSQRNHILGLFVIHDFGSYGLKVTLEGVKEVLR